MSNWRRTRKSGRGTLLGPRGSKGSIRSSQARQVIAASVLVAMALVACGGSAGDEETEAGGDGARIGFILLDLSMGNMSDYRDGAEREAREHGVELLVEGSSDPSIQAAAFENFIALDVDAIVYNTIDASALSPSVRAANLADIPVIAFTSKADAGDHASFISADFRQVAFEVGSWMNTALNGEGKAALAAGNPADSVTEVMQEGFTEGLTRDSAIDLVAVEHTDWGREKGLQVATDILTAQPDLQGFYGMSDEIALGVWQALRAANRQDEMKLAGVDGNCEALQSLLNEELDFTVMLFAEATGALAVRTALDAINGEEIPADIDAPLFPLDTAKARAIQAGEETDVPDELRDEVEARVEDAAAGNC